LIGENGDWLHFLSIPMKRSALAIAIFSIFSLTPAFSWAQGAPEPACDEHHAMHAAHMGTNGHRHDHHALMELEMAAAHGDAEAQNRIGLMHHQGMGVAKNHTQSFKWFMRAAKNGSSAGMNNVGFAYQRGDGVRKNEKLAFKWTWRAAHSENATLDAINHLGFLYQNGIGTAKNPSRAADMYMIAARSGNFNAMNRLVTMQAGSPADLQTTIATFKEEALQGNLPMQDFLGSMHMYAQGVATDYPEAIKWFSMAAEHGSAYAHSNLGSIHSDGLGVPKDFSKAQHHWLAAAAKSDVNAIYNLGVMHRDGQGVPANEKLAMAYFLRGAHQGDAGSHLNAGLLFQKQKQTDRALTHLIAAVDSESVPRAYREEGLLALAHMFKESQGVNRSDSLAFALSEIAGNEEGKSLQVELTKDMSDKEIGYARHLAASMRTHGIGLILIRNLTKQHKDSP
jgi:uncharacterized protein